MAHYEPGDVHETSKSTIIIGGYAGTILRIDLSRFTVVKEPLARELARDYIGGTGFCARLLYDELAPHIDPLGPHNKLIFATGPLTGTFWTSAGRTVVCGKSPLTGAWAESHFGGFWGPELKYAGYDLIILEGIAEHPVNIVIIDDEIKFEDASYLWHKGTAATIHLIREAYPEAEVVCIGQAGENLVKYACIITNFSNAAGRTGLGAVMGAKRVKAITVYGTNTFPVAYPNKFYGIMRKAHHKLINDPQNIEFSKYGTNLLVGYKSAIGEFVTKNHQTGIYSEGAELLDAAYLREHYFVKSRACFACRTHCKKVYRIPDGEYAGVISGGPEYEGTFAFGSNCLNANFGSILEANRRANDFGLDVISAGCTIAFAMECYAEKLLRNFSDLELTWGNHRTIVQLVEDIALRRGIGDLLAEGTMAFAKKLGGNAERFAMCVKGLEISGQDGRAHRSAGLTHAISVRGADHLRSLVTVDQLGYKEAAMNRFGADTMPAICNPYIESEKAKAVKISEDVYAVRDSLITCWYSCGWPPIFWIDDFAEVLYAVTGIKEHGDKTSLMRIGERISTLRRLFNVREGFSRKDDTLPRRFVEEPLPEGPAKGQVVNLDLMLDEYYALRGWDKNGIPPKASPERCHDR
jgi:aldehyde:ferredoxin oxidoreductase